MILSREDSRWETQDDTATAGPDYTAATGTLAFSGASWETKNIVVTIKGDQVVELDEYFDVVLTAVNKPNIGLDSETGMIPNDDQATLYIEARPGQPTAVTEGTVFDYQLRVDGEVDVPIDVWHLTTDIDSEQEDFNIQPHVLLKTTVYANAIGGGTVTLWEGTALDSMVEPPMELFRVSIHNIDAHGRNVQVVQSEVTASILDDDLLSLTVGNTSKAEGTGTGTTPFYVPVTLSNPVEGGVTVSFAINDYTAGYMEGDVGASTAQVVFTQQDTLKSVVVPVVKDAAREANEKFTVNYAGISNPAIPGLQIQPSGTPVQGPQGESWTDPFGLVTIENDDEGQYTETDGGTMAFYDGGDPGGHGIATGEHFRLAAEALYYNHRDVSSWAGLVAALEDHLTYTGRLDEIAIFDHGNSSGQELGSNFISRQQFAELAPFLNDGANIYLYGCDVGLNELYNDWIADDVAPNATVFSPNGHTTYPPLSATNHAPYFVFPIQLIDFDGYEKP